jgi:hypothetical protein
VHNVCLLLTCLLTGLILRTWRWKQYVPPEHRYTSIRLHGVTSQNTVLFIVSTTGISNSIRMMFSIVGWGTMLQAGWSRVRIPMSWLFFNWPNPSSRTMALGSTQPLTEMSARDLPESKGRPARKADNLTAICEPTV